MDKKYKIVCYCHELSLKRKDMEDRIEDGETLYFCPKTGESCEPLFKEVKPQASELPSKVEPCPSCDKIEYNSQCKYCNENRYLPKEEGQVPF